MNSLKEDAKPSVHKTDHAKKHGSIKYVYHPKGTCSSQITLELDGDIVKSVSFKGGCSGNSKGISAIVKGMKAEEVVEKFRGITCGLKPTSCPDQLARAILETQKNLE